MRRSLFHSDPTKTAASVSRKRLIRRRIRAWLLVVGWIAVVWTLGGDSFSFSDSSDTVMPWLDWLTGDLDYRTRYRIYVAIRKSAHFMEYAILALLTFRASLIAASRTQLATAGWVALFIVTSLATADEARQAFSTVRTGSPYDVLIDVAGGLITIVGLVIISRRLRSGESGAESSA